MLANLTDEQKPNVRLDDVRGPTDSVPSKLNRDHLRKVGRLLGLTVVANECYWLPDRLKKGTDKLGAREPAMRLLAGRVLRTRCPSVP